MKTTVATAISIAGVLAAGAGAFAVNSAVLNASPQTKSSAAAATPVDTSVVVESQGLAAMDPEKTNNLSIASSDTSQSTSTYKVGEAGRVILAVVNGEIQVVNVLPSSGWTAKSPEYDKGEVEVKFRNSTMEVEFSAHVKNGQIEVYVESEYEDADESYEREDDEDHDDDDDHDEDDHNDEDDD